MVFQSHSVEVPKTEDAVMKAVVLLFVWLCIASIQAQQPWLESSSIKIQKGLLEWIDSIPSGSAFQGQDVRDISSFEGQSDVDHNGMFATSQIAPGQVLMQVPLSHVIRSRNSPGTLDCELVRNLAQELKLGNESTFAPFVQHVLHHTNHHSIPSHWSDAGRKFLQEIVGNTPSNPRIPPIDPSEWLHVDWVSECGGNLKDDLSVKAAMFVVQWNRKGILAPFAGLYNHGNGNWTNAEYKVYSASADGGGFLVLQAIRDIAPGDEIFTSLTHCPECEEERGQGYGSAELFRDNGFIESFPQHWHFLEGEVEMVLDLVDQNETSTTYQVQWPMDMDSIPRAMRGNLQSEARRLMRMINIDYRNGAPGVPSSEFESALQFARANIQALQVAFTSLENGRIDIVSVPKNLNHYDELLQEVDFVDYGLDTCDSFEVDILFPEHRVAELVESPYQYVQFFLDPESNNVVLDLDYVLQISSSYRPQYHEFMTHSATRFLDSVKRVMFVGGGDSMLLHEILKYPELELVVGLELDQMIVRKSFKYFHTQPHFDDPRVEWWFGDATKSLLLLPEDYWQSFDLVLVDLSETVMSFSVTTQLDVFDALALLLKPDGVMVKNEQYLDEFSRVFDNSMEIFMMCPILCDQTFILGSNGIDFLHAPMKDHEIETLLYDGSITDSSRLMDVHDYRHNMNITSQSKCRTQLDRDFGDARAGILEVLEVELATGDPIESILSNMDGIETSIQGAGFKVLQAPVHLGDQVFVLLEEGYLLMRYMGEMGHCSIDINLWGGFHQLRALSTAVTSMFQSERLSRYRVVVGGMHDSSTWSLDQSMIGPRVAEVGSDCDETNATSIAEVESIVDNKEQLLEEIIRMSTDTLPFGEDGETILICGNDKGCQAARGALEKLSYRLFELGPCPVLSHTNLTSMFDCETELQLQLAELIGTGKGVVWAVDDSVSFEMVQIVLSILRQTEFREKVVHPESLMMTWSFKPEEEPWRQYFLDRYRCDVEVDPISLAQYQVSSKKRGGLKLELSLVSVGNEDAVEDFAALEDDFKDQFQGMGVDVVLHNITGGRYADWDPFDPPEFSQSDYDESEALEQYFEQRPLGYQVLMHLESKDRARLDLDAPRLEKLVDTAMNFADLGCSFLRQYDTMGRGMLLLCLDPSFGSVIVSWDGHNRVDVNYCRIGSDAFDQKNTVVVGGIEAALEEQQLEVVTRQEMPRGSGRVVNFPNDMKSLEVYEEFQRKLHLAPKRMELLSEFVEEQTEDEDEDEDMDDEEDEEEL